MLRDFLPALFEFHIGEFLYDGQKFHRCFIEITDELYPGADPIFTKVRYLRLICGIQAVFFKMFAPKTIFDYTGNRPFTPQSWR